MQRHGVKEILKKSENVIVDIEEEILKKTLQLHICGEQGILKELEKRTGKKVKRLSPF